MLYIFGKGTTGSCSTCDAFCLRATCKTVWRHELLSKVVLNPIPTTVKRPGLWYQVLCTCGSTKERSFYARETVSPFPAKPPNPHRYANKTDSETVMVWAITPPPIDSRGFTIVKASVAINKMGTEHGLCFLDK